mmetsp:Transcript_34440/g.60401  ORF Transcript_34440/g.60401 Transcript_34440/m.60401 type:complete len:90 (-) Transcript_34440:115-384(-)
MGLQYIQQNTTIHLAIKPANLLLSEGIGKTPLVDPLKESTHNYLSDSWLHASRDALLQDLWLEVDSFALGVLIYDFCFGRPHFEAETSE